MAARALLAALCLVALPASHHAQELRVTKCELCEIALEESHKHIASVMGKSKSLSLRAEFEKLQKDSSVWVQYDRDWRTVFESFYFKNPKHWESVMWKFQTIYGAADFEKEDLAKSHGNAGKISAANVYGLWQKECLEISGFCKDSLLREPAIKLNQCGVCRSTVREVYIRLRRFAASPKKVTMALVDKLVEDACEMHLFHNPKKQGSKMQSTCEDLLEDMDGAMVKSLLKAVQASGDQWPATTAGFSDAIAKQVCTTGEVIACEGATSFEGSTAEAPKSKSEL